MPTMRKLRYLPALLLVLPLVAGLGACGGEGPGEEADSVPVTQETQAAPIDSFEQYQLAFADCVREKGVEVPDPGVEGQSITLADEAFLAAATACQEELGRPPARTGSAEDDGPSATTLREEHLAIAECLREHGVDVPDPAPGEDLAIPGDVPVDAFETCAPRGLMGSTGANG